MVVKTTGSWHCIKTGNHYVDCRLKGNLRMRSIRSTNPIAVGDWVLFEVEKDGKGNIISVDDRKNYIIRRSINLSHETQILAANIDQLLLMITLTYPVTPLEFVDRFLVAAEAYHIPSVIIINKTDLLDENLEKRLAEIMSIYKNASYRVIPISVAKKTHLKELFSVLQNKISLLAGNSGVGKTSLINNYCPHLLLKTASISSYHYKGKHTTTYPEMIEIDSSSFVVDSPGISGFGLAHIEKNEIAHYFTDIFKISDKCQFYNCTHIHEPGCAVLEAYKSGVLPASRYKSYMSIFLEKWNKYRSV